VQLEQSLPPDGNLSVEGDQERVDWHAVISHQPDSMGYAHVIGSDVAAQAGPAYCLDKRGIVAHLGSRAADGILLGGAWAIEQLVDEEAHEIDAL
jgi:hypothetical protein